MWITLKDFDKAKRIILTDDNPATPKTNVGNSSMIISDKSSNLMLLK